MSNTPGELERVEERERESEREYFSTLLYVVSHNWELWLSRKLFQLSGCRHWLLGAYIYFPSDLDIDFLVGRKHRKFASRRRLWSLLCSYDCEMIKWFRLMISFFSLIKVWVICHVDSRQPTHAICGFAIEIQSSICQWVTAILLRGKFRAQALKAASSLSDCARARLVHNIESKQMFLSNYSVVEYNHKTLAVFLENGIAKTFCSTTTLPLAAKQKQLFISILHSNMRNICEEHKS